MQDVDTAAAKDLPASDDAETLEYIPDFVWEGLASCGTPPRLRRDEDSQGELAPAEDSQGELAPAEDSQHELAPAEDSQHELAPAEDSQHELAPAEDSQHELAPAEDSQYELAPAEDSQHELAPAEESQGDALAGAGLFAEDLLHDDAGEESVQFGEDKADQPPAPPVVATPLRARGKAKPAPKPKPSPKAKAKAKAKAKVKDETQRKMHSVSKLCFNGASIHSCLAT